MTESSPRVLVSSTRSAVVRDLVRELKVLSANTEVVAEPAEWTREPPVLAFIDIADGTQRVGEARRAFGDETSLLVLVDNESAPRLISAFAAGCDDYVFYPLNTAELRLNWRKHVESGRRPARSPAAADRVALEFPSDVAYLDEAVAQIVRACEDRAISGPRARLNLRVALGEAVANAILYGNRQDPFKRVRVRAEFSPERVAVSVADEGPGFDPELVPDPTQPENRWRSHGRGLFLLQTLMDEVVFNEVGNMVTLVLRR